MKWSFIIELLLIFILLAFAASAAIIKEYSQRRYGKHVRLHSKDKGHKRQTSQNTPNRFCKCAVQMCDCCRDFNLPILNVKGPGCATLQYLRGDQLAISMSFNERVLANTTIKGRQPDPICMPLPGGISKFCGRVYNIGRTGDEFNACLALELRVLSQIEALTRLSCFRFGQKGFRLQPPQPLPVQNENDDDDEDDDDDDDDYDFDGDDDDDGDDDYTDNGIDPLSLVDEDFIGGYFGEDGSASTTGNKKKVSTTTKVPFQRNPVKPKKKIPTKVELKTNTTSKLGLKPLSKNRTRLSTNNTITTSKPSITTELHSEIITSTAIPRNYTINSLTITESLHNSISTENSKIVSNNNNRMTEFNHTNVENNETVSDIIEESFKAEFIISTTEKNNITTTFKEESKEIIDDVVDGVVDTLAGEDSNESNRSSQGQ